MPRVLSQQRGITLLIPGLIVLVIAVLFFPLIVTDLITKILIFALFATSLNLMIGYAGMLPLGQATFLATGAYTYGLLILKLHWSVETAFLGAMALTLVASVVIGFLCLRGGAMTFGLLHLAFNIQVSIAINKFADLTGGNSGIGGVPRPEIFSGSLPFFYFVLAIVVVCFILLRLIVDSPFGKVIQGLRENEERLLFLGINVRRFQLVIFIISSLFAGLAGVLYAMLNQGIYPVYATLILSAQAQMMCIVGGMYSFWGPSLGAVIVAVIGTEVSNLIAQWQGILGLIIIVVCASFQGGILRKRRAKIALLVPQASKFSPQEEASDSKN